MAIRRPCVERPEARQYTETNHQEREDDAHGALMEDPQQAAGEQEGHHEHGGLSDMQPPNQHSADQIILLAKIIGGQGWRAPIVVSKRSGYIVAGHALSLIHI